MTADVNLNTVLNQQQNTSQTRQQLSQDFDQFLILLTTQLQNQDPLSPMDTTEFTNQLVAFSGVEQQINTNEKLDSLVQLQLNNTFSSALGYVGLDVSYLGSEVTFDGETPTPINYALDSEAFEAKINIFDDQGNLIYDTDISGNTGAQEFVWDGTTNGGTIAAPGTYSVQIGALDIDGNAIGSTTVVTGQVRGVETQNGSIFVLVGERAVSVSNVLNASEPRVFETPDDDPATEPDDEGAGA